MRDATQPLLKWVGGKRRIFPYLEDVFPANCENYYEPFVGGGAAYFAYRAKIQGSVYLSDQNIDLINLYLIATARPEELLDRFDEYVWLHDKESYYDVRAEFNAGQMDTVSQAAAFLYIVSFGFNGLWRVNAKGFCNVPYGGDGRHARDREDMMASILALGKASTFIRHGCFSKIKPAPALGDLVYCDPPYTGTFTAYTADAWSKEDDLRLLAKCREWRDDGASVVVSVEDASPWELDFDVKEIDTASSIRAKRRVEYLAYSV